MKQLLFVNNDPIMKEEIKNMLQPLQNNIEIIFAHSGDHVISLMSKSNIDVVIVDTQMSGLNTADLLTSIKKLYPRTIRIALSGHTSVAKVLQNSDLAHQFISKPVSAETLLSSISRAFSLGGLLSDEKLRKLVLGIQSIPSLPSLYLEIVDELQNPNPSSDRVGEIISRDMSMSAKVIQLVNSAYFGLLHSVNDPAQAAVLLGLETIRDLVLTLQIFSQFDQNIIRRLGMTTLWEHSLSVGVYCKKIARTMSSDDTMIDAAFLAGLLHDLGMLVIAENFSMKYYSANGIASRKNVELFVAEKETFGISHGQLGAYLIGLWGLPDIVVEAVSLHHELKRLPHKGFSLAPLVHVSNALDYELNARSAKGAVPKIDDESLLELGLAEKVDMWRQCCLHD